MISLKEKKYIDFLYWNFAIYYSLSVKIIVNCMKGRHQFVELDTYKSQVTLSLNCSVLQGS